VVDGDSAAEDGVGAESNAEFVVKMSCGRGLVGRVMCDGFVMVFVSSSVGMMHLKQSNRSLSV
jgi:hypothetical protein